MQCFGVLCRAHTAHTPHTAFPTNTSTLSLPYARTAKSTSKDVFLLAGTQVQEGNGVMMALAVGSASVGGQIQESVYGGGKGEDDEPPTDGKRE